MIRTLARNTVSCSSMAAIRHSSREFPALKLEKRSSIVFLMSLLEGQPLKKFSQLLDRVDGIVTRIVSYVVIKNKIDLD